jgi:hypothetical protein
MVCLLEAVVRQQLLRSRLLLMAVVRHEISLCEDAVLRQNVVRFDLSQKSLEHTATLELLQYRAKPFAYPLLR